MRNSFCLQAVILGCLIVIGMGYAIEGKWKVTSLQEDNLSPDHELVAEIQDYVFRNATIRWSMLFNGCDQFRYIMEVREDDLYIDLDSYGIQISQQECLDGGHEAQNGLRTLLKRSFKFQILSNFMFFSDFGGTVLIKFQRLVEKPIVSLDGLWNIQRIYSEKTSQLLSIANNTISFCQDKAFLEFQIIAKNEIEIIDMEDHGCGSESFFNAVQEIKYFRKQQNHLTFYSRDLRVVLITKFYLDLQTAEKEEEERKRRQEQIQKRKAQLAEQKRQQILRERREKQLQRQRLLKIKQQEQKAQQTTNLIPALTNTKADLIGKWSITKIFGIPLPLKNFQLIIAEDQIILNGGCNTHIVSYQFNDKIFVLGQLRSTKKVCSNDEDGLYRTGLLKIHAYEASIDGEEIVVQITDQNDGKVYELRRQATLVSITTVSTPPQPKVSRPIRPPSPPPPPPPRRQLPQILPGKYMILLLKRRDLPRKLTKIDSEALSFKFCNNITYSFRIKGQDGIELTLEDRSGASSTCNMDRQDPYVQYLSQATSFVRDELDVMLLNAEGAQIINLNLIG